VTVDDTFAFLLGAWHVTRSLEDHAAGIVGSFEGRVTVRARQSRGGSSKFTRARYEEEGRLQFGAYRGSAHRSLEYVRQDDAGVMVHFTDGRPLGHVDLSCGTWHCTHFCGADRYLITTFVRSPDVVEERWTVHGPLKNFEAVAILTRR
jgi:hypothetical protein